MLEQPDLHHDLILARLRESYALAIAHLEFLPLGADANTAVYCAIAVDGTRYFVKLRRGGFDQSAISLLKHLKDRGVEAIIAPLLAGDGQLWTEIAPFSLVLFPFIEGRNGYETEFTADHWRELGATLMRVHTVEIPPALADGIRREDFAPRWRKAVRGFLADIRRQTYTDPVAVELASFLNLKHDEVLHLVEQTEQLAATLRARPQEFVLCHSDLHAGNVLIDGDGKLY
ncbi:MAG: phosphotransferase, partial [Planctomycetota bacterium]